MASCPRLGAEAPVVAAAFAAALAAVACASAAWRFAIAGTGSCAAVVRGLGAGLLLGTA